MNKLTELEQLIVEAVSRGANRVHPKYLPEVLALVAKGELTLVNSYPDKLEVTR